MTRASRIAVWAISGLVSGILAGLGIEFWKNHWHSLHDKVWMTSVMGLSGAVLGTAIGVGDQIRRRFTK